jgi:hypothetical protein
MVGQSCSAATLPGPYGLWSCRLQAILPAWNRLMKFEKINLDIAPGGPASEH